MKQDPEGLTVLSLDTSSRNCSIAVSEGKHIVTEYNFFTGNQLSSVLIPALEFVLNTAKLNIGDIDLFGIAVGPGLFTGIRIGISTLKGLLLGKKTPVAPVVTLKAMACKFNKTGVLIIPLIDARRNQVYLAGYKMAENEIREIIPPALAAVEELPHILRDFSEFRFIGDGLETHKNYLKKEFPEIKQVYRSSFLASEICKIAHDGYSKKQYTCDLQRVTPFYLKKPDAEKNLQGSESQNPQGNRR